MADELESTEDSSVLTLDKSKAVVADIIEMYDNKGISPKVGAIAACYVACIAAVRAGSDKNNFLKLSSSLFDLVEDAKKEVFDRVAPIENSEAN
jgi:hypothetical protein